MNYIGRKNGPCQEVVGRQLLRCTYADGTTVAVLGGASSDLVGGEALHSVLRKTSAALQEACDDLEESSGGGPLMLHTSIGTLPSLRAFQQALRPHLPASWGEQWAVALQLSGASAVIAACELLRVRRPGAVAVGQVSYHGPSRLPHAPLHLSYPVPAQSRKEVGELQVDFEARIMREQEVFLDAHAQEIAVLVVEAQWGSAEAGQPWPRDLLAALVSQARRRGILVCADEIMCGMGRHGQGRLFLIDSWGIEVDAITFGKSIATGAFALSGVLVRDTCGTSHVVESHTYAHGAQALSLLTATCMLEQGARWCTLAGNLEGIIREELERGVGSAWEIRGQGALWGLRYLGAEEGWQSRMRHHTHECGVCVYLVTGGVLLTPILNAPEAELREALRALCKAAKLTSGCDIYDNEAPPPDHCE